MAIRHTPFITALLLVPAGCAVNGSVQQAGGPAMGEAGAASSTGVERSPVTDARETESAPCPSDTARSWTLHEPTTVPGGVSEFPWFTPSIVVSSTGTATVAYAAGQGLTRTVDDPPAAGDPQDPSQGGDDIYLHPGDHLALDRSDIQTLAYDDTIRVSRGGFTTVSDLVLTDRPPGGTWSSSPTRVEERMVLRSDLSVNASGAAVVVWSEFITPGGEERLRASYRAAAGEEWTAPQRVPAPHTFDFNVGIDDTGSVLLTYDSLHERDEGVYAVRRDPTGRWTSPRRLSGRNTELFGTALSAGGGAVVTHGHVDGDGAPRGRHYATFMTPEGNWGPRHRQPAGIGTSALTLDMDARGRALIAGWVDNDLKGRWSRPDGRWRKPFVVAANVRPTGEWGLAAQVAVNGRGDAVVSWGVQRATPLARARYKPAGQNWTRPVRVTEIGAQPELLGTAIGECGHVAFSWTTHETPRRLHLLRATPRP